MKKKKGYKFTKHGVEVDDHEENYKMGRKSNYPSSSSIEHAGHEMKENPPAALKHTAKKFGKKRAKKQKISIMLSKARRGE